MTKTALANKELSQKKDIAHRDRLSREKIAHEDRKSREEIARKDRWANIGAAAIKGASGVVGSAINDPEWYKRYMPELFRFTNLPTYERVGSSRYQNLNWEMRPRPGVMTFQYYNVIGSQVVGSVASRPVNQILMRSKEMVLKLNSRSNVNWEAGDLGFNIFCSASIITTLGEIKRALEVFTTYHATNAYLAKDLIQAMGVDYNDLELHVAEYRKLYTTLAKRFNSSIVAPKALSLYDRKWFLATNVFTDHKVSSGIKQSYVFCTANILYLDTTGAIVKSHNVEPEKDPGWAMLSDRFTKLATMIQNIVENPDFIEMYADLRAAFGSDIFLVPEAISETFYFNDDELNRIQIHNLRTLPVFIDDSHNLRPLYLADGTTSGGSYTPGDGDIQQDSSGYLYQGKTPNSSYRFKTNNPNGTWLVPRSTDLTEFMSEYMAPGKLCDSPHDDVDGDEILDMTRLTVCPTDTVVYDTTHSGSVVVRCGTEIVSRIKVYFRDADGSLVSVHGGSVTCYPDYTMDSLQIHANLHSAFSDFDWAPEIWSFFCDTSSNIVIDHTYDMYHAFPINQFDLESIHDACTLSLLYFAPTAFTGSGR